MQKWLDLLTPSAAALSLLLAIALLIQAIRHGRAVRRLESRLAEREGAAARVSIDRLSQLQRRTKTSSIVPEAPPGPGRSPNYARLSIAAAIVAIVAGTSWYVFLRDKDTGTAASPTTTTSKTTSTPTTPAAFKRTVPENPPTLANSRSFYTVLVLNGSKVPGAARNIVIPRVQSLGWGTAPAQDAPVADIQKTSFVIPLDGKDDVADNLAKDLGITRREPLDGFELAPDQVDAVDAIVVFGLDLASQAP